MYAILCVYLSPVDLNVKWNWKLAVKSESTQFNLRRSLRKVSYSWNSISWNRSYMLFLSLADLKLSTMFCLKKLISYLSYRGSIADLQVDV